MFLADCREELLWPWAIIGRKIGRQFSTEFALPTVTERVRFMNERQHADWKQIVQTLIKILYAVRIAHELIATQYFEGHPIMWNDTREALDRRTKKAEQLLEFYTRGVAEQREFLEDDAPFDLEMRTNESKGPDSAAGVLKSNLDKLKQEAESLAAEYVKEWIDDLNTLLSAESGDWSGCIRLAKQLAELANTTGPKTGDPDPGSCD
jgi:hypothetical protein